MEIISQLVKDSTNNLMEYILLNKQVPGILPSERQLAEILSISRSTVVKSCEVLIKKGILAKEEKSKVIVRMPEKSNYFTIPTLSVNKTDSIEKFIFDRLTNYFYKPGDYFSELEIAKETESNTVTVREALLKISQSGLIRKEPRQRWQVISMNAEMISEICAFRNHLEFKAINALFCQLNKNEIINEFKKTLLQHQQCVAQTEISAEELLFLEKLMHKGLVHHSGNRYLEHAYESIFTLVQFYLGQPSFSQRDKWRTLEEHIVILKGIVAWNKEEAMAGLKRHLGEAKLYVTKVSERLTANDE